MSKHEGIGTDDTRSRCQRCHGWGWCGRSGICHSCSFDDDYEAAQEFFAEAGLEGYPTKAEYREAV